MERQIRKLGMALLALFLIAFVQINYIQVFAADRIANDPANAQRQLIAEYKVDRGSILAADGTTVLASSRKSPGALRFQRRYPHAELYAHETGFYSFVFGRSELEQSYNDFLTGDAAELLPQTLTDLILGRPKQGATIVTTLVPQIQEAAAAAAAAESGNVAIAAIDPSTGDVLALVSEPSYDPNLLASQDPKVVRDAWDELNADPEKPLLSRASDELFPPGSTFKLVTASAALENGFGPESLWPNPNELDLPLTDATIQNFGGSTCSGRLADHARRRAASVVQRRVRRGRARARSREARRAGSEVRVHGRGRRGPRAVRHPVDLGRVPRRPRRSRAAIPPSRSRRSGSRMSPRTPCRWRSSARRSRTAASRCSRAWSPRPATRAGA